MLMYFIFAEKLPIDDAAVSKGSDPYGQIISGKRPSVPSTCSKEIGRLMQQCWNGDPMKRPPFEQIHGLLRECFTMCRYGKEGVTARRKASSLIEAMNLDREEELVWTNGGRTEFNLLCELLKMNAIPTKRLELTG